MSSVEPTARTKLLSINHGDIVRKSNSNTFDKIGGCICTLICITVWVAMSEIIPLLQSNYQKPYLLRYCATSFNSIFIFIWYMLNKCKCSMHVSTNMIWSGFVLSLFYNIGGYLWYCSLNSTIAAINNTIYQCSVCVAYILSVVFIANYSMSWQKNLGVLLCVFGAGLIGFETQNNESSNHQNKWYGIVECLLSMFIFGNFEVLIAIFGKKYFSNQHNEDSKLNKVNSKLFMTSIIGICGFLCLWPGMFILDWADIEQFEAPKSREDVLSLLIPSLIDSIYVSSFIVGISLMNPVFMAISQLFVIPVSFLYDIIFSGFVITWFAAFGTLMIIIGFLVMYLPFNSLKNHAQGTK